MTLLLLDVPSLRNTMLLQDASLTGNGSQRVVMWKSRLDRNGVPHDDFKFHCYDIPPGKSWRHENSFLSDEDKKFTSWGRSQGFQYFAVCTGPRLALGISVITSAIELPFILTFAYVVSLSATQTKSSHRGQPCPIVLKVALIFHHVFMEYFSIVSRIFKCSIRRFFATRTIEDTHSV